MYDKDTLNGTKQQLSSWNLAKTKTGAEIL